ncbi:MAG: glycerate-2-kinase family protein, partial [Pirellulaceae bacterium]|nr:glycerate-2-kinase family protein [Pirellulaceae bacterium]
MSHSLPLKLAQQSLLGPPGLSDALQIWWAGVTAARPDELFAREARIQNHELHLADASFDLRGIRRIVVVGAGKASANMASALYRCCLESLVQRIEVVGWINAPAGSFTSGSAGRIYLHAARPAGMNEPTVEAVAGTMEIMRLVESCGPHDLCIVLLSGGGSAILTAPIEGITLSDKQQVARHVAAAGANIAQLNTVRRALSRVKGGGLARICRAREMITLIISDVLGDPLETIASGPTLSSAEVTPSAALTVLDELNLLRSPPLGNVVQILQRSSGAARVSRATSTLPVSHIILANNATAVDAAGVKAVELGYRYIMQASRTLEGDVRDLAIQAADTIEQ